MKIEHTVRLKPDYNGLQVLAKRCLLYCVGNRETLGVFEQSTTAKRKIIWRKCGRYIGVRRSQAHTSWEQLTQTDIQLVVIVQR